MLEDLKRLQRGSEEWNLWRKQNPSIEPNLTGVDLSDMDLSGFDLSGSRLDGAELCDCSLVATNLKYSNLQGADLAGANLTKADLFQADLSGAFLTQADLSEAYIGRSNLQEADFRGALLKQVDFTESCLIESDFSEADLSQSILVRSKVSGAKFINANLASCNLLSMEYGGAKSMRGTCRGIRGLETCYGNALFVRDARDQDYLDTLENQIKHIPSPVQHRILEFLFWLWSKIDYGRSLLRPTAYAFGLILLFGFIYSGDYHFGLGLMNYSASAQSWLTPFYCSFVVYSTLGFGDITPIHWIGEALVIAEVILGYVTLGLLLSILANRVSRRS